MKDAKTFRKANAHKKNVYMKMYMLFLFKRMYKELGASYVQIFHMWKEYMDTLEFCELITYDKYRYNITMFKVYFKKFKKYMM